MTNPGSADQIVYDQLNGIDPEGGYDEYQLVKVRARTVYDNLDENTPFQFPLGADGANVAATPATFDAVTGTAEQIAWRFVDAYGNVWEPKKLFLIAIQYLLDNVPLETLAQYMAAANTLNPWPEGFAGAMPGEEAQTYPAFPPAGSS